MLINIHTHKDCQQDVICIQNLFPHTTEAVLPDKPSGGRYYSCGLHPWHIEEDGFPEIKEMLIKTETIIQRKEVIALGEAGLDKTIKTPLEVQEEIFIKQVRISEEYRKPMIIHCVKAYNDIVKIKKQMKAEMIWIIHGFNSSPQMATQLLDTNCMLSFGPFLFEQKMRAPNVLKKLNPGSIFLETDDGKRTIEEIYQRAAELQNITKADLKQWQQANFEKVFSKK